MVRNRTQLFASLTTPHAPLAAPARRTSPRPFHSHSSPRPPRISRAARVVITPSVGRSRVDSRSSSVVVDPQPRARAASVAANAHTHPVRDIHRRRRRLRRRRRRLRRGVRLHGCHDDRTGHTNRRRVRRNRGRGTGRGRAVGRCARRVLCAKEYRCSDHTRVVRGRRRDREGSAVMTRVFGGEREERVDDLTVERRRSKPEPDRVGWFVVWTREFSRTTV